MATLRVWLDSVCFDWSTGKILVQSDQGDWYRCSDDWTPRYVDGTDPILDKKFDCGYGSPQAPCFVAEDSERLYFPSQYDGATNIEYINKDISTYLSEHCRTPYPGG